jgi:hypothetical protein
MEYIACYRKNFTSWGMSNVCVANVVSMTQASSQQGFNQFEEANKKLLLVAETKNCPTTIISVFRYLPKIFKEKYIAYKLTPSVKISFNSNDAIY